jgi:spore maturation protein CgeB
LETYDNRSTLKELILTYLADEKTRESKAKAAREFATKNHTFKHRISQILLDCEMPHFADLEPTGYR